MSYADGWAAINLEMPSRVPRTEYSANRHWDLVNAVLGTNVSSKSDPQEQEEASIRFVKAWNYDYYWTVNVSSNFMVHGRRTDMGHGVYEADGADKRQAKPSPFQDVEDVYAFDPAEEYGVWPEEDLVEMYHTQYAKACKRFPDCVNSCGVYITMFSGFIDAFGWEMLLLAAGYDPVRFGEVARRWEKWISQFFVAFAKTDVDVFMCHDDIVWSSGPILHPAWYREYVFPAYKRLWAPIIEAGKKILFTSDGDYTLFVDDIAQAGAHGFVLEPLTDLEYIVEKYGKTHVIIGNVDTRVLLTGTKEDIRAEVERCMRLGKPCPGYFMAVGNHIPPNTPVENALYYNEVYEELSRR